MKRGCLLIAITITLSTVATASSALLSTCSPLKISGYVDSSYNYLERSNLLISGLYNRANDITENGLTLQQAAVTFSVMPLQGVGGRVDTIIGRDAYYLNQLGFNPDAFNSGEIGLAIPSAYLQYAISSYTFYLGNMQSLAGFEQNDYGLNSNFSRSIENGYAQPGSHVGWRAMDQWNEKLQLTVGLNNGWSTIEQIANLKTGEFGVEYNIPDVVDLMVDGYVGIHNKSAVRRFSPTSNVYLFDMFGTWYLSPIYNLAMNYDYGVQNGRGTWNTLALYFNYNVTDQWQTSVRGEIYEDSEGVTTGVKQNWRELTLTLAYKITKQLMLRAETRHDFSNVNAFVDNDGISAVNNQQSYALEAYYSFAI